MTNDHVRKAMLVLTAVFMGLTLTALLTALILRFGEGF